MSNFLQDIDGILLKMNSKTRYRLLGEVTSLLMSSDLHKQYKFSDLVYFFLTPIHLNQFRIYKNTQGKPVGLVTWAFLSDEIEKKYMSMKYNLAAKDWNSGKNLWFIDFLAPYGDMKMVAKDLRNNIFPNHRGKSVKMDATGRIKGIGEWKGKMVK